MESLGANMRHKWLGVPDAAKQIGIEESTVYRLCKQGKLAHYRIGAGAGRICFTPANIDEYLRSTLVPVRTEQPEELAPGFQVPSKWLRPQGSKRA